MKCLGIHLRRAIKILEKKNRKSSRPMAKELTWHQKYNAWKKKKIISTNFKTLVCERPSLQGEKTNCSRAENICKSQIRPGPVCKINKQLKQQ